MNIIIYIIKSAKTSGLWPSIKENSGTLSLCQPQNDPDFPAFKEEDFSLLFDLFPT